MPRFRGVHDSLLAYDLLLPRRVLLLGYWQVWGSGDTRVRAAGDQTRDCEITIDELDSLRSRQAIRQQGMNSLMDDVVNLFLLLAALVFLSASFFGRDFDFKPLGSQKPGQPAPAWLARPFFFVGGVFLIWGAYTWWKQR